MNTLENNEARGASQDTLNLRPLGNRLGHNGPYFGGTGTKVERDCDRIDGHTPLFRNLERFEKDLREAIGLIWNRVTELHVIRQRVADGVVPIEDVLEKALDCLGLAFRWMQESYMIAEGLDDRALQREKRRQGLDFLSLVGKRPREEMSGLERLAEEARLEWMICALLDRTNELRHVERRAWPTIDRLALELFNARLDGLINPPTADKLQAMSDEELAEELRTLEARIRDSRKAVTLIHAVKTVRDASRAETPAMAAAPEGSGHA